MIIEGWNGGGWWAEKKDVWRSLVHTFISGDGVFGGGCGVVTHDGMVERFLVVFVGDSTQLWHFVS